MKLYENPEFLEMRRKGVTLRKMAEHFGKKPKTIFDWVKRAAAKGLVEMNKNWTPEEKQRLADLRSEGKTNKEIAAIVGRSVGSVEGQIRNSGMTKTEPRKPATTWTAEQDAILRDGYAKNLPVSQISKRLDRSPGSVAGRAARLKLVKTPNFSATVRKTPNRSYDSVVEANKARAGRRLKPRLKTERVDPEIIPLTARPWLTRTTGECVYPYGPRGNIHACCLPVWDGRKMCEEHQALCYDYTKPLQKLRAA